MRKPSEYLPAALARLRSRLMPDAAREMRHGDERGEVVQSSSRDFGGSVSESGPSEVVRVVAAASDFPTIGVGSAVELGDSLRVVTSLRGDPVGALFSVGLSAEFEKCRAAYAGTRREGASVRRLNIPVDAMALENGAAENFSAALAPSYATSYLVAIRRADWPEVSDPEVSDLITLAPSVVLKVSTVARHDGWYVLKCRTKEQP